MQTILAACVEGIEQKIKAAENRRDDALAKLQKEASAVRSYYREVKEQEVGKVAEAENRLDPMKPEALADLVKVREEGANRKRAGMKRLKHGPKGYLM